MRIPYTVDVPGFVTLDVLDVAGRLVTRLYQGMRPDGAFDVSWDGTSDGGPPSESSSSESSPSESSSGDGGETAPDNGPERGAEGAAEDTGA